MGDDDGVLLCEDVLVELRVTVTVGVVLAVANALAVFDRVWLRVRDDERVRVEDAVTEAVNVCDRLCDRV